MKLFRAHRRKTSINITSLIDVLFLLLIFFLLSSTFKEQPGMELELPESQTAEQEEIKDLVLVVDFDQANALQYKLNNTLISPGALAARLKELATSRNLSELTLKADQKVPHGTVVHIMDLAKQNNIKKIIIATRYPGGQDGQTSSNSE
ncbi:biopolymer transporter ExbD [bacterium]|nr:biopolymer transporter ExbD [bacterium]